MRLSSTAQRVAIGVSLALGACGELEPLSAIPPPATVQATNATVVSDGGGGPPARDAGPGPVPDAGALSHRLRNTTLYPIIMAHGFSVAPNSPGADFHDVLGALQDAGFAAFPDQVAAYDSIANRGASLLATIEEVIAQTGSPAVNVIAHSMGGLDARFVVSSGGLGRGDLVASISTISTPHRGTAMADTVESLLATPAAPFLSSVVGAFSSFNLSDPHTLAAIHDLSEAYAVTFNATMPDDPAVYYQSWAGVATSTGLPDANIPIACEGQLYVPGATKTLDLALDPLAPVVGHGSADWVNDGVVAVESAKWGSFRGCLPVDHFNEIGSTDLGPLADPDPQTGFDLAGFYLGVARDLAQRGF